MARALSKSYGVIIDAEAVMFTVGGHHALASTFSAYRVISSSLYVVSALPFYPAHRGWQVH